MCTSRQAAEAGDADAMAHLGHAYANGVGTPQSNATALHWFRQVLPLNFLYCSQRPSPIQYLSL